MKRILFVDDEQGILDGLRRMLRPHRQEWEMEFALGADAAFAILETRPFDVIVSDMRMPELDGAALLEIVREKYPNMLRIILSGYTDLQASLRAVPVAHQFLLKPCNPDSLRAGILRSTALNALLDNRMLSNLVGSTRDLPAAGEIHQRMKQLLEKKDASVEEVLAIAERDVAISAKILQLVNSAFFGVAGEVTELEPAIKCLGVTILHELMANVEVFREIAAEDEAVEKHLKDINEHSLLTARIAREIVRLRRVGGGAEVAAMLHDVGKLVILERTPTHYERALAEAREEGLPMHLVEQKLAGFSHAEVGGYLLSLWGLPNSIVEAVANHHEPKRLPRSQFDATAVVYTANCLANEIESKAARQGVERSPVLDVAYLGQLGVGDFVAEFRKIAEQQALHLQGVAKP